ncbi:MAG: protoporphyrinogen oxidase [Ilumatobacteraceae bacterium]|nr:protoporphyrinogen oxidase [Ilumatobacteraceae bacterium]
MVVGGGITGLTAAYRLSQGGVHVTVIEPDRLGGKLQTSVVAGRPVDETADAFLLRVPWALALCHDLEVDGELISPAERTAHLFLDGVRKPLPGGHVMGVPTDLDALAASGIVSAAGVERARADLTLPPGPADPQVAGDDVAVGPYLRSRLGDEVVDHLIDPLLGGINAGDTAGMSLAAVVPQLDAAARSGDPSLIRSCLAQRQRVTAAAAAAGAGDVGSAVGQAAPEPPIFATPIGGMARLIDALVALMPGVDIREGRRVDAIERRSAPGTERVLVALDDGSTLDVDAVIVTCPAHAAGPLLAEAAPDASSILSTIDHSSIAMVTMAFERSSLGDTSGASGCLVPRDQGMLVTAVSYATSKWAQLRDPVRDDVILRTSVGRSGDVRFADLDDHQLTEQVLADLDRIVGVTGAPTDLRIGRWLRSFPQYAPGHLDRMDQVDASLAGAPIAVAGMFLRGVGVPACIRSAEEAVAGLGVTWPTRRALGG